VLIPRAYFKRRIAVPHEHGAYALFLGPLVIGYAAGGSWSLPCVYLLVASTAGFFMRQPLTTLALVGSGRRTPTDLAAARFWVFVYGAIAALHITGLVLRGYGFVLHLVVPGALVAAWQFSLVRRRAERRQMLLEILATGVLALAAPAAMWIGSGGYDPWGWLLWVLVWTACTAAIVHTHQRLAQRTRPVPSTRRQRMADGRLPLTLAGLNLGGVLVLGLLGVVPLLLALPYALQGVDIVDGTLRPAWRAPPRRIGVRQLIVFVLFTAAFIGTWRA